MAPRKLKAPQIRSAYLLIAECVEQGLTIGYRRAHKHIDKPSEDHLLECQESEIMLALSERFDL